MKKRHITYILAYITCLAGISGILTVASYNAHACTSAIVAASRGVDGRWLLWKHRDTGHLDNFVARVAPTDSTMAYVALFNAEDSLLQEAWIGFNEAGFAVMNTATYNIPAPADDWKDREGLIISHALRHCTSLDNFRSLLREYPGPRGVQANFGAIDAHGNGAYFEVNDEQVVEFPLDSLAGSDHIEGVATRTNYSLSGTDENRLGLSRHKSELHQLDSLIAMPRRWAPEGELAAEDFLEVLSRSFLLPVNDSTFVDLLDGTAKNFPDKGDVISRRISTASVVIRGPRPEEAPSEGTVMEVMLGFPALSTPHTCTIDSVPPSISTPAPRSAQHMGAVTGRRGKYRFNTALLRKRLKGQR